MEKAISIIFSVCFQAWVANFERPRMNANSLLASPTGLSPYLRFGCLSCRLFYFKLTDLYKKVFSGTGAYFSKYFFLKLLIILLCFLILGKKEQFPSPFPLWATVMA